MSKRAEEAALKAYPVHPKTIFPQEGKHGEILNFDEWLDDFRISVQSFSLNAGFRQGYELAEKDLGWHSVDESLPPIDEEVIVLTDVVNINYPENKIDGANFMCLGHIVDPDAIVDVYGNPYKIVEYNGWNIPGVKYWMPMPKIPNEDE